MPRFIFAGIAVLYLLLLFYPSGATGFTTLNSVNQNVTSSVPAAGKAASPSGKTRSLSGTTSSKTKGGSSTTDSASSAAGPGSVKRSVVNIVVDRIDGPFIYSKDGNAYEVPVSVKVINNRHLVTKMRTAELFFENGSLVAVSIK